VDYGAEFSKPGRLVVRTDTTDWNGFYQPTQNRELACTEFPTKDRIGISARYERKKSILLTHYLYGRCWIWTALTKDVDGSKRKWTAFEARPLLSEV